MPAGRDPSLRVVLLPRDTNPLGTIFGGVILSLIDQAGAIEARRTIDGRFVTVAMKEVEFHEPVYVGDLVSLYTETLSVGRTSITVKVVVEARRRGDWEKVVRVTEATVVYVAVDESGRKVPIAGPESPSGT